jgi:hypothetical protein
VKDTEKLDFASSQMGVFSFFDQKMFGVASETMSARHKLVTYYELIESGDLRCISYG